VYTPVDVYIYHEPSAILAINPHLQLKRTSGSRQVTPSDRALAAEYLLLAGCGSCLAEDLLSMDCFFREYQEKPFLPSHIGGYIP